MFFQLARKYKRVQTFEVHLVSVVKDKNVKKVTENIVCRSDLHTEFNRESQCFPEGLVASLEFFDARVYILLNQCVDPVSHQDLPLLKLVRQPGKPHHFAEVYVQNTSQDSLVVLGGLLDDVYVVLPVDQ